MQENQIQAPPIATAPVQTPRQAKPEKNLYEPYDTPIWIWGPLRALAKFAFWILLDVRLFGRENVPTKGPFIIAPNHLSWVDVPLVPAYLKPKVTYLAKEEAFHSSVGWLVRLLGAIPVKRGKPDRNLLRAADDLLKRGKILAIFPEGHRSENHQIGATHGGTAMFALRAGVQVVPVAITGSEYALKRFRPRITITYGKPITLQTAVAGKVGKEDVANATNEIIGQIAAMLPEKYRGGHEVAE